MKTSLPEWYGSRHNCEPGCPHLLMEDNTPHCMFYDVELDVDGSDYGMFFMCDDCVEDTYGPEEVQKPY